MPIYSKHIVYLLVCMIVCGCSKQNLSGYMPGQSSPDLSYEFNPNMLTAANHPRLVFTEKDFETIHDRVSNKIFNNFNDQILNAADSYLKAEELIYDPATISDLSKVIVCRLPACAYAYKVTSNRKYLERTEKDLIAVCNFKDWNSHEGYLDTGEIAAGVALAYDWLYHELKPETKKLVQKAIRDFAFYTAENKIWNLNFYVNIGNWNQVCTGGLIAAALAIYESNPKQAREIILKGVESNRECMAGIYAPDGNYVEGYSYWNYGTSYQMLINSTLESATGNDMNLSQVAGFPQTGKFALFMEGTVGMNFNYSDSTAPAVPCLSQWYLAYKFKDLSLLYHEKSVYKQYAAKGNPPRFLPIVAYYAYKLNIKVEDIPMPEENVYVGRGLTPVVLFHGNWKRNTSDKFLGIKGGKAGSNHAHMDAGSFVYESNGVRWADDIKRPSYVVISAQVDYLFNMGQNSGRWTIKQFNNMHHNTLTVNGKHHDVNGSATIVSVIDEAKKRGALINLTPALGKEVFSAIRTVYMEGDDLLVTDEIEANKDKDAEICWTLVTKCVPQRTGQVLELKSVGNKCMYLEKSSSTGHNPFWFVDAGTVVEPLSGDTGYYRCGYTVTLKKGESAKITIRFTPDN